MASLLHAPFGMRLNARGMDCQYWQVGPASVIITEGMWTSRYLALCWRGRNCQEGIRYDYHHLGRHALYLDWKLPDMKYAVAITAGILTAVLFPIWLLFIGSYTAWKMLLGEKGTS